MSASRVDRRLRHEVDLVNFGGGRAPTRGRTLLAASIAGVVLVGGLIIAMPLVQEVVQPSRDCGQDRIDPATGSVSSTEVRRCILAAYEQHIRARSEHVTPTMEGDPIMYSIRLSRRDEFEVTIDTTKDRFGSGRVSHEQCRGMRGNGYKLTLFGCGAEGHVIEIQ